MTPREALGWGGSLGALGVGLGAFASHWLRERIVPEQLAVFETGVRYQLYHALALVGIGLWLDRIPSARLEWAARAFVFGSLAFSGSLYALAVTGARWLGPITPIGGVALITGWVLVALAAGDRHRA